jgi:hypothetical protein
MARIVAVVATEEQRVCGGVPVFVALDAEQQQRLAESLEKILDVNAHRLMNDVIILVDHSVAG